MDSQQSRGDYTLPEIKVLKLSRTMKLLLSEIAFLHKNTILFTEKRCSPEIIGCYAENRKIAARLGLEMQTVSKYLMILRKEGYIEISFMATPWKKNQRIITTSYAQFVVINGQNSNASLTEINGKDGSKSNGGFEKNQTDITNSSQSNLQSSTHKVQTRPTPESHQKNNLSLDSLLKEFGGSILAEALTIATVAGKEGHISYIWGICKNKAAEKNSKPLPSTSSSRAPIPRDEKISDTSWDRFLLWAKGHLSRGSFESLNEVSVSLVEGNLNIFGALPETLRLVIQKYFTDKVDRPVPVLFLRAEEESCNNSLESEPARPRPERFSSSVDLVDPADVEFLFAKAGLTCSAPQDGSPVTERGVRNELLHPSGKPGNFPSFRKRNSNQLRLAS
ncbi:hypothetical protein EHO57_14040 [Leptospira langatensis]|uniref:Uncharacterized protein n=1 Tax=Leptospira langatensis TaxID=2484983 RepID=A0A5R2ASV8_9LEPT|nr:hypothetical protein [Leptospira langatensis]TGJ99875.1 hypothetical protein EHO57_14040 [Leptospira langatensis]